MIRKGDEWSRLFVLPSCLLTSDAIVFFDREAPSEVSEGYSSEDEEERSRTQRTWKSTTMQLWNQIAGHKDANLFRHPVTNEVAQGYEDTVFRPMDLGTIKKNVDAGIISSTRDFEHAVMLMFANALMYNKAGDFVYVIISMVIFVKWYRIWDRAGEKVGRKLLEQF